MNKYKSNYNALKDLPIVQKLLKKNEKLKKENASLKNLIYSLPEFRKDCYINYHNKPHKRVHIKKEPGIDAEIIDLTDTNHENITYSLVSESSDDDNKVDSFGNYPIYDNIKTVSLDNDPQSDDDFTCTNCDETFPNNYCFLCDRNNICKKCEGSGGDYGKKEEWICSDCIHLQSQNTDDELDEPVIKKHFPPHIVFTDCDKKNDEDKGPTVCTKDCACNPPCDVEDEEENCIECNITLDRIRDGDIKKNFRCNNCYWEDTEGNNSKHIILPDYRNTEKFANCDICCQDKSFENYYLFKRGRKQELYSCVNCWENRKTQIVGDTWTWSHHTFPGPAFFVNDEEDETSSQ